MEKQHKKRKSGAASSPKKKQDSAPPATNANTTHKMMEVVMTQNNTQFDQFFKQANDIGRENMDALVKSAVQSATIWGKGYEELFRTTVSLTQESVEKQTQYAKEALGKKTVQEMMDLQTQIAQTQFDDFMSSATKISEISTKLVSESLQPLNDQMSEGIKKATEAMAA